jgi:hypothetical protein
MAHAAATVCCYLDTDIANIPTGERKLCGIDLPGWYFWDESESQAHGPFDTKADAESARDNYFEHL